VVARVGGNAFLPDVTDLVIDPARVEPAGEKGGWRLFLIVEDDPRDAVSLARERWGETA
jgi:hypothetical protein